MINCSQSGYLRPDKDRDRKVGQNVSIGVQNVSHQVPVRYGGYASITYAVHHFPDHFPDHDMHNIDLRWFRYRTRTLLLIVVALSIILTSGSLLWHSILKPLVLQEKFESFGLILLFDESNQPAIVVAEPSFTKRCSADQFGRLVSNLPVRHIYLSNTDIDDNYIKALRLTDVRSFTLDNTRVTDGVVETLLSFDHLEFLHLSNTKITDEGAILLGSIKSLKQLTLHWTNISDETIERLNELLPHTDIRAQ